MAYARRRCRCILWVLGAQKNKIRSNIIFKHTQNLEIYKEFSAAGGAATDIFVQMLSEIQKPYLIDIEGVLDRMNDIRDLRRDFLARILDLDICSCWVTPIIGRNLAGEGVLNVFLTQRSAPIPRAPDLMLKLAYEFMITVKRNNLLKRTFDITDLDISIIVQLSEGRTAVDISSTEGFSPRAIEQKISNIRKKLRACNTLEDLYRAAVYGIIPS